MKRIVVRYGLISSIVIVTVFGVSWSWFSSTDFATQEALGYAGILISVSFVFLAIRQYREEELNGYISFLEGLKIGTLVILFPSIMFGILDIIYVMVINPDFMDQYYSQTIAQLRASLPAEEFAIKQAQLEAEKAMFENPWMQFVLMSLTVFIVGFIVTLISALILRKAEPQAH